MKIISKKRTLKFGKVVAHKDQETEVSESFRTVISKYFKNEVEIISSPSKASKSQTSTPKKSAPTKKKTA